MTKIFLISGKARVGKTTIGTILVNELKKLGKDARSYAFADELKRELDPLCLSSLGFSAFTEDDKEKRIVRPLLQCWGTSIWRQLDHNHWVKKVHDRIKEEKY